MAPEHGTLKQEVVIERTKEKLLETVKEYKSKHCNQKGEIQNSNLSAAEKLQLKSLKKDIKDKNIVIFTTDKSGKFTVDSPKNYEKALMKHTTKDEELIEEDKVRKIENKMNQHLKQLSKMFKVGENNDHEHRIAGANTSTNTEAPPLYGLRKDHKETKNEIEGPPVRPVCGAKEAPNSRLSHFLSRIVNDYADNADIGTECRSSEEMRASFEAFNEETSEEVKLESKILSMDVKALYPSMEWEEIITAMKNMIEESDRDIEDVDWHEVGKYLCVTVKEDKLKEEGLMNVIPTRKGKNNRSITVAYLCNRQNDEKWIPAKRIPRHKQRKKMLALAVTEGIRACLEGHVYKVGDRIFLQKGGGPIGLELTGAVSRAFMARWDKLYLKRVKDAGIKMHMYERYVDDSNQVATVPPKGAKYDKRKKKVIVKEIEKEDVEAVDSAKEKEERLTSILKEIANDVMPCIEMEADWPEKNSDKKLPILDMKVWMDAQGNIIYQHYEKPMTSKTVLHSTSAHLNNCNI